MVHVQTEDSKGKVGSGSAFHIGEGWLVSARHVAEDHEITRLSPYAGYRPLSLMSVLMPSEQDVDLVLLETDFPMDKHLVIGGHLDDWFHGEEFIMTEVLLMGYPPIPVSKEPFLVATAGEINAVIDPYLGSRHPYFIISNLPRGGFSGGPVIADSGELYAVMIDSLLRSPSDPAEVGFAAAVTVEPLWNLLHEHGVYPGENGVFLQAVYDHDQAAQEELMKGVPRMG